MQPEIGDVAPFGDASDSVERHADDDRTRIGEVLNAFRGVLEKVIGLRRRILKPRGE
jgi:hypothetical protein